ncbi:MAG: DNA repair protein RecN [Bacteroidota bacterium]
MLQHLYIKNYALFTETEVDFQAGFNVLTGETGAGKSLLVGALGLINGKRADSSVVFREDEKCVVEARFHELSPLIQKRVQSYEEFDFEGKELIIRREITPSGKSRAFINDTPVSLQILRQVSNLLLDMHGQHENQSLLQNDQQLSLLDAFAATEGVAASFGEDLRRLEAINQEIKRLREQEATAKQRQEFLQFQVEELRAANIQADEENELEQELNLLQNSEEVREAVGGASDLLYHQDESMYHVLSALLEPLRKVSGVNEQMREEIERLEEMCHSLKESAFNFQAMLEMVDSDPERLAFIEERLAIYYQLKLKLGVKTGEELMAQYEAFQAQLAEFSSLEDRIEDLVGEQDFLARELAKKGVSLEARRVAAKTSLEKQVCALLEEVGFQQATFEIQLERQPEENGLLEVDGARIKAFTHGINKITYVVRTNPGMPPGPLAQIASGGEISRVMLAIKAALAEKSSFPVLIFDEIDAGISGEIAKKVGQVMYNLARKFQILSITHLPQIAAKGDHHFQIEKSTDGVQTTSQVRALPQEERVEELAKMISGKDLTPSALNHARELMN